MQSPSPGSGSASGNVGIGADWSRVAPLVRKYSTTYYRGSPPPAPGSDEQQVLAADVSGHLEGATLVNCNLCLRPVRASRFAAHLEMCRTLSAPPPPVKVKGAGSAMVLAKRAQPAPRPASSSTSKRRTASDALDDADPAIELTGVPPQSQQHQQQRPRVRKKRRLSDSSDEAYQPPSELMEEEVEAVGSVAETRQQAYAAGAGGAGSSFAPLEASGAEADEDARLLRAWCDEARRLQPVPLALRQYLRRNRLRRTLQISFAPPSAAAAAMHPHHAAAAAAATSLQFLQPPQSQQQPPPHAGLVQPSTNPFMLRAPTSTGLPSAMPAGAASKPLTMSSASGQSLALAQQAQQLARKPGGQFASLERKLGPSSDVMPIMQQRRIMQELQAQGGMYGPEAGRYYGAPVPAALKPVAITQSTTLRSPAAPAPSVSYAKQPPLPYASPTPPAPAPAPAYSKPAPADTKALARRKG